MPWHYVRVPCEQLRASPWQCDSGPLVFVLLLWSLAFGVGCTLQRRHISHVRGYAPAKQGTTPVTVGVLASFLCQCVRCACVTCYGVGQELQLLSCQPRASVRVATAL